MRDWTFQLPSMRIPQQALWSVHDIGPATFSAARDAVEYLTANGRAPLTLLVVPAGQWEPDQVKQLADWQRAGHLLALHGWDHRAVPPSDLYHRIHSAVISHGAAEHLGRRRAQIAERVSRGRDWFIAQGLGPPRMYVPPAWAMGELPVRWFAGRGFDWVETQTGIYRVGAGAWARLPVIGFEARGRLQPIALRASNAVNLALARVSRRPLRVAVHPHDLALALNRRLRAVVEGEGLAPMLPPG